MAAIGHEQPFLGYPEQLAMNGRHGMPPFANGFVDAQLAAVVNPIRTNSATTIVAP